MQMVPIKPPGDKIHASRRKAIGYKGNGAAPEPGAGQPGPQGAALHQKRNKEI